jgi:hypothetical protein
VEKPIINEEVKQSIINWIDKKWSKEKRICEICQYTDWAILDCFLADIYVEVRKDYVMSMKPGGMPRVAVACKNCGNTKYFCLSFTDILTCKEQ